MILALSLAGLFAQDCVQGFRRSQDFSANRVIYAEENFFDSDCGMRSLSSRSYGTYTLGSPLVEAREIDFTFEKVTLQPATEEVAAGYRARALCGLTSWEAGKETEISGLACDFLDNGGNFIVPAAGDIRYGIVKIEEGALRFGRLSPEFNGSSPGRRPRFLDPLPYLRKMK